MSLVVFRCGLRRDLARPDTPGSRPVRGTPALPPGGRDHVRFVRPWSPVRAERLPGPFVVEPAQPFDAARFPG
jgi:hypothetical protein